MSESVWFKAVKKPMTDYVAWLEYAKEFSPEEKHALLEALGGLSGCSADRCIEELSNGCYLFHNSYCMPDAIFTPKTLPLVIESLSKGSDGMSLEDEVMFLRQMEKED